MKRGILLLGLTLASGAEGLPGEIRDRARALAVLDRLVSQGPGAEEAVDWQRFAGYDYQQLSETHKAVFRKAFLKAFARSFQDGARGHSFAQASERFRWNGSARSLEARGGPWRVDFTPEFKVLNFRW